MDSTIKQALFTTLIYIIYIPTTDFTFWTKIRIAEENLGLYQQHTPTYSSP